MRMPMLHTDCAAHRPIRNLCLDLFLAFAWRELHPCSILEPKLVFLCGWITKLKRVGVATQRIVRSKVHVRLVVVDVLWVSTEHVVVSVKSIVADVVMVAVVLVVKGVVVIVTYYMIHINVRIRHAVRI